MTQLLVGSLIDLVAVQLVKVLVLVPHLVMVIASSLLTMRESTNTKLYGFMFMDMSQLKSTISTETVPTTGFPTSAPVIELRTMPIVVNPIPYAEPTTILEWVFGIPRFRYTGKLSSLAITLPLKKPIKLLKQHIKSITGNSLPLLIPKE